MTPTPRIGDVFRLIAKGVKDEYYRVNRQRADGDWYGTRLEDNQEDCWLFSDQGDPPHVQWEFVAAARPSEMADGDLWQFCGADANDLYVVRYKATSGYWFGQKVKVDTADSDNYLLTDDKDWCMAKLPDDRRWVLICAAWMPPAVSQETETQLVIVYLKRRAQ